MRRPPGAPLGVLLGVLVTASPLVAAATSRPATRLVIDDLAVYLQQRDKGAHLVARAYVRAGRDSAPPGEPWVADLCAAWILAGGSGSFPGAEFEKVRSLLGMEARAYADRDLLVLELSAPPAAARQALRLLADLLAYPAFPPAAAARARAAAEHQVWAGQGAGRDAFDPARGLVWRWLALGGRDPRDEAEEPEPAWPASVSREQVSAFHEARFGSDTTVLVVEGPLTPAEAQRELRPAFVTYRKARKPVVPPASHPGAGTSLTVAQRRPGGARLLVARAGLPRGNDDWLPLEAALLVASASGAARGLREGRVWLEQPLTGPDVVVRELEVGPAGVDAVTLSLEERVADLRRGRVAAADLERAKHHLERVLIPPPEAAHAAVAHALLEALGLKGDGPAERYQQLRSLDARQVARAARRYFR